MSFEDKYSWKILTQFSSVVESYYRLGLMDANKSQDVKAVNEIIERDVLKDGFIFMNEWGGMVMDKDCLISHYIVQVERTSQYALSFYIANKCTNIMGMAILAYSYYVKGLENGLIISQTALIDYFKRTPSLEAHLMVKNHRTIQRINRNVFIQELALETMRIKSLCTEKLYSNIGGEMVKILNFINKAYKEEKNKRWEITKR